MMEDDSAMMEEDATMSESSVVLSEQSDSGENGTVTLTEEEGQVTVVISLTGAPETAQPAHIHTGSCPTPGGVVYPLTNVVNGMSETVIDVTMAELESQLPLAVNVHKSAAETNVYVACGDLSF
ncbi:CHRD domain-containing protein [Candidatus Roizmanbacteria bacterium]|nr:CHRD domain-containing protein [Candidatus Roizmanbacteria bacterium]